MKTLLPRGCALRAFASTVLALGFQAHAQFIATGVEEGAAPHVKAFSGTALAESHSFLAYPTNFTGGVRVAVGDINGDKKPDIITAAGPGGGTHVKVFDGTTGAELRSFFAYTPSFSGGIYVAAGDVNNDGFDDIVTGAGTGVGVGPHVKVFSGANNAEIRSFYAFDPGFNGGVRVAAGDVNGDGIADIITGAGGQTTHVKVFNGTSSAEIGAFIAYDPSYQGGVYVAAGDIDGDGRAEVITGPGESTAPVVKVFGGAPISEKFAFLAYETSFMGGVRVAVGDVNGDGQADVITGPGTNGGPHVRVFNGRTGAEVRSFFAYPPTFTSSIYVGSRPPRQTTQFTVTTEPPTAISFTTATLHGTVNANGGIANVSFRYGPNGNLSNTVPAVPSMVSGREVTAVSADLSGLSPGTIYIAQVVATDGLGDRTFGQPITFTTTVNNPPAGGTFDVLPGAFVPAGTQLTAVFGGWTDVEGHTPFTYEVREGTTVVVPAGTSSEAGFELPVGTHQLYGRIYDGIGTFAETAPVEVVVVGDPESTLVYTTGGSVPGAGTGQIPPDAKWAKFGVPAIDNEGDLAFLGSWVSSSGKGAGIYHSAKGMLAVRGGVVPGAGVSGTFEIPDGAVFKNFKDPVSDDGGMVAFIATMSGKGITAANDSVIVSNGRTGALEVIAREGSPAPGANGAKFRFFSGVSSRFSAGPRGGALPTGGVVFTARLSGARSTENEGAWWVTPGVPEAMLLVRKGGDGFAPGEKIKNFILLQSLSGSPGHGRGHIAADKALLQVTLSGGKQAQVLATPGALEVIAETGDTFDENSSVWIRMSQPSSSDDAQNLSVLGTFDSASAGLDSRPGVGILKSVDGGATWSVLAEVGEETGSNVFAVWVTVGFPVNSPTGDGVAFTGKAKESAQSPYAGIWWMPEDGELELVARAGEQAAECSPGEDWLSFQSLALPGGAAGPLFIAKVKALRERAPRGLYDTGVWGIDRAGSLRLLFREGTTTIDGKTLKRFNVLQEVSGSPGVTRAFNNRGQVAWLATFADGKTGIVVTQVP